MSENPDTRYLTDRWTIPSADIGFLTLLWSRRMIGS